MKNRKLITVNGLRAIILDDEDLKRLKIDLAPPGLGIEDEVCVIPQKGGILISPAYYPDPKFDAALERLTKDVKERDENTEG